jgi:hypothetical protein
VAAAVIGGALFSMVGLHIIDAMIGAYVAFKILKQNGTLILEDGHQARVATRDKIGHSVLWEIVGEAKEHVICVPG